MIKFEKRFLYTFADVEEAKRLIGKKGIFSDEPIDHEDLRVDDLFVLEAIEGVNYPFTTGGGDFYRYFYYDPNLECKRAYYLENKKIQFKLPTLNEWTNFVDGEEPSWRSENEYRIKPEIETHLTNRQVAEWLAKGGGQILIENVKSAIPYYSYDLDSDDSLCPHLIRKWSDDGWHEATKEYIEGVKE